jgi:hypothetical protein
MPANRLPWVKVWIEALDHEKFSKLSDAESWTWVVLLAKSSQQPKRWRFASVEHAHHVTHRPAAHIKRLLAVGLLNLDAEGIAIHDASLWQDSSNLTASHREQWRNDDATLTEDQANTDGRVTEHMLNSDLEGEGEGEGEGEKEREKNDDDDARDEPKFSQDEATMVDPQDPAREGLCGMCYLRGLQTTKRGAA